MGCLRSRRLKCRGRWIMVEGKEADACRREDFAEVASRDLPQLHEAAGRSARSYASWSSWARSASGAGSVQRTWCSSLLSDLF